MTTIVNTLGAGSGIDTEKLVSDLVAAQRATADKTLNGRKDAATAKISALGQVTSTLSAFSSALTSLAVGGTLSAQARSSDADAVGASFTGGSVPLDSAVEVRALATAQTISSGPVSDANAAIGRGTITFDFGVVTAANGAVTSFVPQTPPKSLTITVGAENDSLGGLARSINAAKAGVTASVVRDGMGSRLVLKSATGAAQGFTVTADPVLAAYGFGVGVTGMTQTAGAQDAELVVDGVVLHNASNNVSDVLPGVKLELKRAQAGKVVSMTASRDGAALGEAVNAYVSAYNEVQSLLATLTKAPTDGGTDGGALRAENSVRTLQGKLKALTSSRLLTSGEGPSSLAEIGVKTNRDGTLAVDTAALTKAIAGAPDRIEQLLTASQSSSSPLAEITSAVGTVKPGTYAVTDIIAATAGSVAAAADPEAFDAPVTIDAGNKTFRFKVDGKSTLDVLLPEGDYADGDSLAAAMQSAINADATLTAFAKSVSVRWTGDGLTLTSNATGSASMVGIESAPPAFAALLGLGDWVAANGASASGKINGVAATGVDDRLVGAGESAGLILQIRPGVDAATIVVNGGITGAMAGIYSSMGVGQGALASAVARITKEQAAIAADGAKVDERSATMKNNLTKQFAAMETAVAAFKSTQDFLEQQIDAWNAARSSR